MKKQRLPKGWDEKRIRKLAEYYDRQTEDEQAAEIDAAVKNGDQTLVVVPTKLVSKVLQLIGEKRTA